MPGDFRKLLPTEAPLEGESFEKIFSDTENLVLPNLTLWQHPKFYAYYPATISHPAIIGEMFSTAFSVPGFTWYSSPGSSELEEVICDWAA